MDQQRWDIFCSKNHTGSIWAGVSLALGIGKRGLNVRLFCDDVKELSIALGQIEPDLWIQTYCNVLVLDARLAPWCSPSSQIVQVFDTPLNKSYLSRFVSQPPHAHWIQLQEPWAAQASESPLRVAEQNSTYTRYTTKLGKLVPGAGFLRPPGGSAEEYPDRMAKRHMLMALLDLFGLERQHFDHAVNVLASGVRDAPIENWLRHMVDDEATTCLFVPFGPLQSRLSRIFALTPGVQGLCTVGSLTIAFLPPLNWTLVDQLIACCTAVVTEDADMLLRASIAAVPVLWTAQAPAMLNWYLQDTDSETAKIIRDVCESIATADGSMRPWRTFMSHPQRTMKFTCAFAEQIRRAPQIDEVLVQAIHGKTEHSLETLFAPTQPSELLE